MTKRCLQITVIMMLFSALDSFAQEPVAGGGLKTYSLKDCIDYALQNQPALKQANIGVLIARTTNHINLSGWLPQVNGTVGLVHYVQLPTVFVNNPTNPNGPPLVEHSGVANTFIPAVAVNQTIFSPGLLYSATSAKLYIKEAQQVVDSSKIGLVAAVSKSFYGLLLTLQQIDVLKEDTVRLAKNMVDAYHQFKGGIVDETDYQQATITYNNSVAQLRQANENVAPQYAILKQLMGFSPKENFNIVFDTAQMAQEILIDTTEQLQYEKRIEYQQLATARALQHKITNYYWFSFLPSLGAYYDYNYEYENQQFSDLFSKAYPNSLVGVSLNFPIFTGFSRIESLHRAKLQEKLFDYSEINLKAEIYSDYSQALANYRSNLNNLQVQKGNTDLARQVYTIVQLQYKQGIVPYLNVITAESNLITSEVGYNNSLFEVLSSKIDLEKAMGKISY